MDIFVVQAIANSIPDLFVSQNETRAVGLLFCLRKILINAEFALFSIGQGVCIEGRGILEQRPMYCQSIRRHIILS